MDVFQLLKDQLNARSWNMTDFARSAGVSKQVVSQWLAEDEALRIVPSPTSCEKIASALNVDPDYILTLAGHRKPRPNAPMPDPIQAELDARLARLSTTLSRYPRAFWLAVALVQRMGSVTLSSSWLQAR